MKYKAVALIIGLLLLICAGVLATCPLWIPSVATWLAPKGIQINISDAHWAEGPGLYFERIDLNHAAFQTQLQGLNIRLLAFNSQPQVSIKLETGSLTLNAPSSTENSKNPPNETASTLPDLQPLFDFLNWVPQVDIQNFKITAPNTEPLWVSLDAQQYQSDPNQPGITTGGQIRLEANHQPPIATEGLDTANDVKNVKPLIADLSLSPHQELWALNLKGDLESFYQWGHGWLDGYLPNTLKIQEIKGTIGLEVNGVIQSNQLQWNQAKGMLNLDSRLDFKYHDEFSQHHLKASLPFSSTPSLNITSAYVSLNSKREPKEPTHKTKTDNALLPTDASISLINVDLSQDLAGFTGKGRLSINLSGKQWSLTSRSEITDLIADLTSSKVNLTQDSTIALDSQIPEYLGVLEGKLNGTIQAEPEVQIIDFKKSVIEAKDIRVSQGRLQRAELSTNTFQINRTDDIRIDGRFQAIIEDWITNTAPEEKNIKIKKAKGKTLSPSLSAQLSATVTPVQQSHNVLFDLKVLDKLHWTGNTQLTLSQEDDFQIKHLQFKQTPLKGDQLLSLMQHFSTSIPEDLQFPSGDITTKGVIENPLDPTAPINIQLNVNKLNVVRENQAITDIDAALLLKGSIAKFHSKGLESNQLRIKRIQSGIEIQDLTSQLFLEWNQSSSTPVSFTLSQVKLNTLGGTAQIPSFQTWPLAKSTGTIKLQQLDLSKIIALQSQPGIAAAGQLQGQLPFGFNNKGEFYIKESEIKASDAGGFISVKDNPAAASFKTQNPQLKQAFDALENLQFDQLTSTTSMSPDGKITLKARIRGRNPDLEGSRPIDFNYTHEENIYLLLKSLMIGDKLAQEVEKHIQKK